MLRMALSLQKIGGLATAFVALPYIGLRSETLQWLKDSGGKGLIRSRSGPSNHSMMSSILAPASSFSKMADTVPSRPFQYHLYAPQPRCRPRCGRRPRAVDKCASPKIPHFLNGLRVLGARSSPGPCSAGIENSRRVSMAAARSNPAIRPAIPPEPISPQIVEPRLSPPTMRTLKQQPFRTRRMASPV